MTTLAAPVPLRQDAPTIGLVSFVHGLSHFCQLVVPPLFPFIGASMGLSNVELGMLMTTFFVVSFLGQAAAGFFVDRLGASRVLYAGLALLSVAALGLGASPGYGALLVCMAVAGLGNSVFHPVDFSILNARISAGRLGHAYAAHGISGSLGWAMAPVFVIGITQATGSWRVALFSVAVLVLAVLLLVWLCRGWLALAPSGALAPRPAGEPAPAAESPLAFLRLPAVWSCFAFFLVATLALGAVKSFAPLAAGHLHGIAAADVAMFVSIFMACSAAGMVLGGHLAREQRRSTTLVACGYGTAACMALLLGLGQWSAPVVALLFGVMGVGTGLSGPARDLLVKAATPRGATGRVYGVVYSGLDVGMALSPLLFGLLMDRGAFTGVWLLLAALQLLLIAAAFNVRRGSRPVPALAAG
jgi:FSR family fosmidomycin resistance protein-like MFS transporter